MLTHKFKLTCGVECEVKELIGKHQKLMTSQDSVSHTEKLNELLADVIVRVGSNTNIGDDFVEKMLASDKKKALVEVRQFSLGFEDSFTFTYTYKNAGGKKKDYPVEVDLEGGKFPETKMKVLKDGELVEADFDEYDEVLNHNQVNITLPRSGEDIRFNLLDSKGEQIGENTSKKNVSSHTVIEMRNPVKFHKKEGGKDTVPIKLNLDKLSYRDIEYLRGKIKDYEGEVDTTIMFEHPDKNEDVDVDVLSTVAFFFPSEAI